MSAFGNFIAEWYSIIEGWKLSIDVHRLE